METLQEVEAYIAKDSGDAPASRYGRSAQSWRPVAIATVDIMAQVTGEPFTAEGVDHIVGLVVNDHDDIEYLIREYGPEYGYNPDDYLD